MMFTQFALATSGGIFTAEQFSIAGSVTLQGMLCIFGVLAILWGVIELMHVFLTKKTDAPKKTEKAPAPAVSASNEKATEAAGAAVAATEDHGAIVAAITAAIMAARAENGETGAFRVVSFKRAGNAARRGRF